MYSHLLDAIKLATIGHRTFSTLERISVPVVCAMHGACLGSGLECIIYDDI